MRIYKSSSLKSLPHKQYPEIMVSRENRILNTNERTGSNTILPTFFILSDANTGKPSSHVLGVPLLTRNYCKDLLNDTDKIMRDVRGVCALIIIYYCLRPVIHELKTRQLGTLTGCFDPTIAGISGHFCHNMATAEHWSLYLNAPITASYFEQRMRI